MSGAERAKVTRASLTRLARRLEQVEKGAALLEKRRDALVIQLFARVRPSIDARRQIEQQAALAYRALVDALAVAGRSELAALGWPSRELRMQLLSPLLPARPAMPQAQPPAPLLLRSAEARALLPGQFDAAAEKAAQAFERLIEIALASAPEEAAIRRLGQALAHTVRQVNVLQRHTAVDLGRALVQVRRTLDEREREEAVRLRHIAACARR